MINCKQELQKKKKILRTEKLLIIDVENGMILVEETKH